MGTWGTAPWDNDYAADWFGDALIEIGLAQRVAQTLQGGFEAADAEEVRAAAAVLLLLGHVYVWPIEELEAHLELAVARLNEAPDFFDGDETALAALRAERDVLALRLQNLRARRPGSFVLSDGTNRIDWSHRKAPAADETQLP
jgi:hypothetical protein